MLSADERRAAMDAFLRAENHLVTTMVGYSRARTWLFLHVAWVGVVVLFLFDRGQVGWSVLYLAASLLGVFLARRRARLARQACDCAADQSVVALGVFVAQLTRRGPP